MNIIKKKVSADRIRFTEGNYNLDLAYITKNLIAMGIPANGLGSLWRNSISEVSEMLNQYHQNNYMIYNLSESTYDYQKFDQRIIEYGFPDHHNPPIDLLFEIVFSMYNWLKHDPNRVAVVHCVGGKGRTGTVIASYLLFAMEEVDHPLKALNFFAEKRSLVKKGVTQPSQIRYVSYFHEVLGSGVAPHRRRLVLKRITFVTVPSFSKKRTGMKPVFQIYQVSYLNQRLQRSLLFQTALNPDSKYQFYPRDPRRVVSIDVGVELEGDVLLTCYHNMKKRMFRCSFHTAFIDHIQVLFPLNQLDDTSKNLECFSEDFKLLLMFELPQTSGEESPTCPPFYDQMFETFEKDLGKKFGEKARYTYYDRFNSKLRNSLLEKQELPPRCLLPLLPHSSPTTSSSSPTSSPSTLSSNSYYSTPPLVLPTNPSSPHLSSYLSSMSLPSPSISPVSHYSSPPSTFSNMSHTQISSPSHQCQSVCMSSTKDLPASGSPRRVRSSSPHGRITPCVNDIQWILSQSKQKRKATIAPPGASIIPPPAPFTDPLLPPPSSPSSSLLTSSSSTSSLLTSSASSDSELDPDN